MLDSINLDALTPEQVKTLARAQQKLLVYFLTELGRRVESDEHLDLEYDAKLTSDEWPIVALLVNRRRRKPDQGVGSWSCRPKEVLKWLLSELTSTPTDAPAK